MGGATKRRVLRSLVSGAAAERGRMVRPHYATSAFPSSSLPIGSALSPCRKTSSKRRFPIRSSGLRQPASSARTPATRPATMFCRYGRNGPATIKYSHVAGFALARPDCRMGLATWQMRLRPRDRRSAPHWAPLEGVLPVFRHARAAARKCLANHLGGSIPIGSRTGPGGTGATKVRDMPFQPHAAATEWGLGHFRSPPPAETRQIASTAFLELPTRFLVGDRAELAAAIVTPALRWPPRDVYRSAWLWPFRQGCRKAAYYATSAPAGVSEALAPPQCRTDQARE
jgi:hypothetical protein